MNEIQAKRNQVLRLLDRSYRIDINKIKKNLNASETHENKKEDICKQLVNKCQHFVTEAYFKGKGRADILCLDTGIIYEIICSETIERLENKSNYYPSELKIVAINV